MVLGRSCNSTFKLYGPLWKVLRFVVHTHNICIFTSIFFFDMIIVYYWCEINDWSKKLSIEWTWSWTQNICLNSSFSNIHISCRICYNIVPGQLKMKIESHHLNRSHWNKINVQGEYFSYCVKCIIGPRNLYRNPY